MVMSDPLSRAYVDKPCSQTEYCNEIEEIILVDDLPISHARLNDFRKVTACVLKPKYPQKSGLISLLKKKSLFKMACCSRVTVSLYRPV